MKAFVLSLLAALAVTTASAAVTGDVNGDGAVTSVEVTVLYNYLLNGDNTFLAVIRNENESAALCARLRAIIA